MAIYLDGVNSYRKVFIGDTGVDVTALTFEFEIDGVSNSPTYSWVEDALGWYTLTVKMTGEGSWTALVTYNDQTFYYSWTVGSAAVGDYELNDTAYGLVYLRDTGIVRGDVGLKLKAERDGVEQVGAGTITEQGSGWYDITLDLDAVGDWSYRVTYGDYHYVLYAFCEAVSGGGGTTIQFGSTSSPVVVKSQQIYRVRVS